MSPRSSDHDFVRALAGAGRAVVLDLSDDRQYRHVIETWQETGRTAVRMPHLFDLLEQTREVHRHRGPPRQLPDQSLTPEPVATVTGVGMRDRHGPADVVGSAVSSIPGGTEYTGLTLQLLRADTGEPIGPATNVDTFGSGVYVPIQAVGHVPSEDVPIRAEFLSTTASAVALGEAPLTVVAHSALFQSYPRTPPQSTAPVQKAGRTVPYVLICLLRPGGDQADCDYGPYGVNVVQVPISGSITYFDAIAPFTADNASASLFLVSRKSGGGPRLYMPGDVMTQHFTISATDPTSMSWNFLSANFGVDDPFANYEYVDILLQFNVTTAGGPDQISAWVTSAVDTLPGPSVAKILPLQFATGCVAEGTRIALADGSTRAIERLVPGDRVRGSGDGSWLTVRATSSGREDRPMVVLLTGRGATLELTEGHPVLGPDGPVPAGQLALGDRVLADDGLDVVAGIERRAYDGRVWNVTLGADGAPAQDAGATLFANGILVGDANLQVAETRRRGQRGRRHTDTLATLPAVWHDDYLAMSAR